MDSRLRTLWSSLLIIGLLGAVAGTGVFAVFTDPGGTFQNVLQGGSVDLKLDGGDGSTTFAVRDADPGNSGRGVTRLSNAGSQDGILDVAIENGSITNAPGVTYEPEPRPDEGEMGEVAEMALFVDRNRNGSFDGGDIGLAAAPLAGTDECLTYGPATLLFDQVDDYEGCTWEDVARLGADRDFVAAWRIPDDAGNETMGDQVFVKFTFILTQT